MRDLHTTTCESAVQTAHDDASAVDLIEGSACFFVVLLLALAGYLTLAYI